MTIRKLLLALCLLLSAGAFVRAEIYFQNDGTRKGWPNYPQTPQAHGTLTDVTNPVFQGTSAIKFTQTFDPTHNGRYHSEVVNYNCQSTGESRYYRTTVYLPTNWVYAQDAVCVQQWAGDGPWLIMEVRGTNLVILPHVAGIQTIAPMPRGQWVRIVTHLVATNSGLLEVWVDGVKRLTLKGNFVPNSKSGKIRWSAGEYVTRWYPKPQATPNPSYRELFQDNFRMASTFEEADAAHWPEGSVAGAGGGANAPAAPAP